MHYYKTSNEIMQYCIFSNDIALIMHYRALLKRSGHNSLSHFLENKFISCIGILICIQCLLLYRAHTYTKKKIVEHKNVNIRPRLKRILHA